MSLLSESIRDSLVDAGSQACGYMNCKLFVQTVTGVPKLDDLPSRPFRSINELTAGDVLKWGNGLHWAIYIGDGDIMEVEEWGAESRIVPFSRLLEEMDPPDMVFSTVVPQKESLLREYVRELLEVNLGTGVGIAYTAFVLDSDSAATLRAHTPEGWQPKSHHMTLIGPKHQKQRLPSHWLDFEDKGGQMKVVAVAKNDKVITGLVDLGGLPVPMKGPAFPHVTIAVNPEAGGKAYMSNEFQLSDFEPIKPIPITGAVEEILR